MGDRPVDIRLEKAIPRGDQELKFVFDIGAVDERYSSGGMQGKPGPRAPKTLSPEIRSTTITIVPDEEFANTAIQVTEIWRIPIEFKDVPLERLDLTDR